MPKKRKIKKKEIPVEKYFIFVGVASILFSSIILIYNLLINTAEVYKGITPCADCPGIEETITFNKDKTYSDRNVYLERNISYTTKGSWEIIQSNADRVIFELINNDTKNKNYYLLRNNKITPLDSNLKELPYPYNSSLEKQ